MGKGSGKYGQRSSINIMTSHSIFLREMYDNYNITIRAMDHLSNHTVST